MVEVEVEVVELAYLLGPVVVLVAVLVVVALVVLAA